MPDDRSQRSHPPRPGEHRPPFSGPRPFRPPGRLDAPPAPIVHSVRLREGDRELEVSGSAGFVRQVLEDLHTLWPRLRGEGPARPAHISMPPPPPREPARQAPEISVVPTLDDRVISVLREAARPLAVAAIRKRLGESTTPQQVRRVLERNSDRLTVAGTRPATYRLR